MNSRIKRSLGLAGGVGLLLVVAWLAWRSHDERSEGARPVANDGAGKSSADEVASTLSPAEVKRGTPQSPKMHPSTSPTLATGEFRVRSAAPREGENARDAKARELVSARWEKFVRSAHPTSEQQQAILSAIYDAQLYYAEVRRVEREWAAEWAERGDEEESGPPPESSWTWMDEVSESVSDRASEVLDEQQFKRYQFLMNVAVVAAVPAKWVEPVKSPGL